MQSNTLLVAHELMYPRHLGKEAVTVHRGISRKWRPDPPNHKYIQPSGLLNMVACNDFHCLGIPQAVCKINYVRAWTYQFLLVAHVSSTSAHLCLQVMWSQWEHLWPWSSLYLDTCTSSMSTSAWHELSHSVCSHAEFIGRAASATRTSKCLIGTTRPMSHVQILLDNQRMPLHLAGIFAKHHFLLLLPEDSPKRSFRVYWTSLVDNCNMFTVSSCIPSSA